MGCLSLLLSILAWIGVMILGSALFGIDPTWQEIALILVAGFVADLFWGS